MERLKHYLVLVTLLQSVLSADKQELEINVKIQEDVPNHLCHRFFTNLEVRIHLDEEDLVFYLMKIDRDEKVFYFRICSLEPPKCWSMRPGLLCP